MAEPLVCGLLDRLATAMPLLSAEVHPIFCTLEELAKEFKSVDGQASNVPLARLAQSGLQVGLSELMSSLSYLSIQTEKASIQAN